MSYFNEPSTFLPETYDCAYWTFVQYRDEWSRSRGDLLVKNSPAGTRMASPLANQSKSAALFGNAAHGGRVPRQLKALACVRHPRAVHFQDRYVLVEKVADVEVLAVCFDDTATTEIYTLSLHDALRPGRHRNDWRET